jgi:hypothetical protein
MTGMPSDPAAADVSLIQPGWRIYSKDGLLVGEVVAVDQQLIHIHVAGDDQTSIDLRTDTVIEQEEPEMRARVALTAADLSLAPDASAT